MTNSEIERRAHELVDAMTVEEAASQLLFDAPAVERLGIPAYNWWNEALHGVARAGTATVFPQSVGMAAMFDDEFLQEIFSAISDEARAKYNVQSAHGDRDIYKGLTFWTPNINIFRDPRWGRGQETYGEDPYLTSRMGVAVVKGLQGDGEYLKTAACAKHFAAHSGPEGERHRMDVKASPKDLEETYLPAFEAAVKEGKVEAVMGAYTRLNGDPCCAHPFLNEKIRGEWGFDGHIVSDCWAVRDFHDNHKVTPDGAHSASLAVKMGCDINCGCTYRRLLEGLEQGLISEEEIRTAAFRAMRTRLRLGMFSDDCAYDAIPFSVVDCAEHRALALKAAERSAVLLENDGILPLDLGKLHTIAVIGPNAYRCDPLFGNYNGDSSEYVTNLDGIRKAAEGAGVRVLYARGCDALGESSDTLCRPGNLIAEAVAAAECADAVVLCLGLDCSIEGEEGDSSNGYPAGDRPDLLLPKIQERLMREVLAAGKPTVLVLNSGSCLDTSAFAPNALLQMWYSGERGGEALANILFGKVSPSGKLPITFYYDSQPMPDFCDYSMQNRTYRYLRTAPLYPFGYGLGYSDFDLSDLKLEATPDGVSGSVLLTNVGSVDAEQVVEGYLSYGGEAFEKPTTSLCFYKRVALKAGESVRVPISVAARRFESVLEDGSRAALDGEYTLYIGFSAPDERSVELVGKVPLSAKIALNGGKIASIDSNVTTPIAYPETFDRTPRRRPNFTPNTGIGALMRDERTAAVLERFAPGFTTNPQTDMLRDMYFPARRVLEGIPGLGERMDELAAALAEIE